MASSLHPAPSVESSCTQPVHRVAVIAASASDEAWLRRVIEPGLAEVVCESPLEDAISRSPPGTKIVAVSDTTVATPRVDHVITRAWPPEWIHVLLTALTTGPLPPPVLPPIMVDDAARVQRAIAGARRLTTACDLATCETLAVDILAELLELDRAYCLYHDNADGSLWSEARRSGSTTDDRCAIAGITGFAARTGMAVLAPAVGRDPRFAAAIDNPEGAPSDQLVAQPIRGRDGAIHAVLVGVRRAQRPPFSPAELALLARFAALMAAILEQLELDLQAKEVMDSAANSERLFRAEALQAQQQQRWGDIVRVSPSWLPWAFRALCVLFVAATVVVAASSVTTYSTGPVVIRSLSRIPITARSAGNVIEVETMPGSRIEAGAVIARFDDTVERDAVGRLEREFETQLRNHMRDPRDATADALLREVRDQLASARDAMGERVIRATRTGVVGDVRVRLGQRVESGDLVATVFDTEQRLEVLALLPGEDRPRLAPGMMLRLELAGYRYAYQSVVIESVSPDVISPAEARRVVGAEIADSIQLTGPVVLVRGRLPSVEFVADGRSLAYHDGMRGTAEVHIGDEPIAYVLIPGMRRFR